MINHFPVSKEDMDNLVQKANDSPRRRAVKVIHPGSKKGLRVVVSCLRPGSYIRPHLHPAQHNDSELLHIIQGKVGIVIFSEAGDIKEFYVLDKDLPFIEFPVDTYHTAFALSDPAIITFTTLGPFDPETWHFPAVWAPEEGSPEVEEYLNKIVKDASEQ